MLRGSSHQVHSELCWVGMQRALPSSKDGLRTDQGQIEKGNQRLAPNIEDKIREVSSVAHELSFASQNHDSHGRGPGSRPSQGSEGARRERQQEQGTEAKIARLAKSDPSTEGSVGPVLGYLPPGPGGGSSTTPMTIERQRCFVRMVSVQVRPTRHPTGTGDLGSPGGMWR